jgi:hypothetical protein
MFDHFNLVWKVLRPFRLLIGCYSDFLLRFLALHWLLLRLHQLLMLVLDHYAHVIAHYDLSLSESILEELLNGD